MSSVHKIFSKIQSLFFKKKVVEKKIFNTIRPDTSVNLLSNTYNPGIIPQYQRGYKSRYMMGIDPAIINNNNMGGRKYTYVNWDWDVETGEVEYRNSNHLIDMDYATLYSHLMTIRNSDDDDNLLPERPLLSGMTTTFPIQQVVNVVPEKKKVKLFKTKK